MFKTSQGVLLFAGLLLCTTSCMHRRTVVFDHDPGTGQDTMTYRGKAISAEELYELGEKADFDKIDLILKRDGKMEKLDFKKWHTGMKLLPGAIQSMQEDAM
ncbi:hypothetical protein [Prosthecobacter sp.]|uniref:hypothetical protein n=1 Tax=Prosthecobacter sp. TaxID=1965333 RepID=UPI0024880A46|nr:hypothetical protein [Prosthecobacter sp.]MDI1314032.1 hypothetical protein [Prosthecobacter sp.]